MEVELKLVQLHHLVLMIGMIIRLLDLQILQYIGRILQIRPGTSEYARERSGKNDQMHIIIVDDKGDITGVAGQILEKNLFLSKGKDTRDQNTVTYYKDYLALNSAYLYAGKSLGTAADTTQHIYPASSGFEAGTFTEVGLSDGDFGQEVQGITFNSIGSINLSLWRKKITLQHQVKHLVQCLKVMRQLYQMFLLLTHYLREMNLISTS